MFRSPATHVMRIKLDLFSKVPMIASSALGPGSRSGVLSPDMGADHCVRNITRPWIARQYTSRGEFGLGPIVPHFVGAPPRGAAANQSPAPHLPAHSVVCVLPFGMRRRQA